MTQNHFPTLTHPDFVGQDRRGDIADAMAESGLNVGACSTRSIGWRSRATPSSAGAPTTAPSAAAVARIVGPVVGFYNTRDGRRHPDAVHRPLARENSRRAASRTSWCTRSISSRRSPPAVGADIVPKDRAIDGVNQLPFFEGKQRQSNRESVLLFTQRQLRAVKWHDWKLHYDYAPKPARRRSRR
jgi:arylsulfatase